jgi:hypothetical protein
MHLYLGLVAWGVVAFVIYKAINVILAKRQLAGECLLSGFNVDAVICDDLRRAPLTI